MRRLFTLFVLLFAFTAQAQDTTLMDNVLSRLARHPQVRATFTQSRENPALAAPQVSRGDLLFAVGHGMLWHTHEPFDETLAMTAGNIVRVDAKGRLERARDGNRGVAQVSGMLQGMLGGKVDEAARQFTIDTQGSIDHWTLRFVPRQARVAKVLAGITLRGGDFLDAIEVDLASGERTVITFANTRNAGPLSTLEMRLLGIR